MSENGPDLSGSVNGLNSSLDKLLNKFTKIDSVVGKLDKKLKGLGKSVNGATSGSGGTGSGNGFNIGGNDATFSGVMDTLSDMSGHIPNGRLAAAVGTGFKVAGSVSNMMPDVNATMTRMSQGYNAAVMNGYSGANNSFRSGMQASTLAMMKNGLTSAGADVQVANIMASSGIAFNSNYNSTYNQNVRETAGISKYLNIDNGTAAQSMADLTSGATSANLMRNLGIMTSDPMSGKMYSFKDIANQFESRISRGGKITAEGVMDSYHRGFLGVSLQNSGFDSTQQQMILQDLMSKAKTGKGIDWANTSEMDKLSKDNPMLSQYKMNYSDTRQMQKGEGAYKTGIDAAVSGLTKLNEVAGNLAATFGSLKSGVDTFAGHRAGAGALNIAGDLFNGAMQFFGLGGGSSSTIGMTSSAGSMGSIGGLGRASGGYSRGGGGSSSTTGVDTPGSTPSPSSTSTGSGGTSTNQKAQAANTTFKTIKPVKGGRVITDYGVRGKRWAGGVHKALDWDVAEGTPVVAGHDGIAHAFPLLQSEIGNHVKIWWTGAGSDRTYATQYCHLKTISIADGQQVKQGDLIGYSGQTGTNCDGPHLHFEVWKNGDRVNPHDYIDGEASGAPTTSSGSNTGANGDSGSSGSSSKSPLPVSLTAQQQVSVSNGNLSSNGSTDYYSAGGGTSSRTGIDVASAPGYTSAQSGKNYLTTASGGGQTHSLVGGSNQGHSKANVTINLTIGKATDNEAKKFADKVKEYLQEDRLISNMGRS
jgi:murein DD-endopeptidase MepM/ murein hydrolase activator NlpD